MNGILAASRALTLRLLALAVMIVPLLMNGQAAAAAGVPSAGPPAYAESVVNSTWSYWRQQLAAGGHPGWGFQYWISNGAESVASPCGVNGDPRVRPGAEPAAYCAPNNTVYLSSSFLFDYTRGNGTAPYGMAQVIAHEVGHAVQAELGLLPGGPWVEPVELQADCLSGAWTGYQVRTGQASAMDANDAQRQVQSAGDYESGDPRHHGTPYERVSAWRTGFNGGPSSCA